MRDMRLCFGGSFNPIHFGHLRCARTAAIARGFATITLVPAAQPPHKPASPELAPATDRMKMAELASSYENDGEDAVRWEVDSLELHRAGPSYTIDTVHELKRRGWTEVWWLIGADMLNYLPRWHRADELIQECNFLILARPNVPLRWNDLPPNYRHRLAPNLVAAPMIDISSTQIRERIRKCEPIDDLTPPPVVEYIRDQNLYAPT